ncbi:flavoprotein [Streptomyces sp. NBC_00690]|uniref:flavoprotein n=1 Tax=Streptomyces sp. NBC_00690 TaxID=2975808 RepID=UPI002E2E095A|nr:flavoprotein [Streptomyces sp. NBC_00690]
MNRLSSTDPAGGPPPRAPRHLPLVHGNVVLIGTGAFSVVELPGWAALLRSWYGWSIRPCLTHSADRLVSREALAAAAGAAVRGPHWPTSEGMTPHQELAAWAELIIVAPATTNFVAKCATGMPDSLAVSTVMSSTCPVVIAPSVPEAALHRPSVRRNLKLLEEEGHYVVPTQEGMSVHTGRVGSGAMADLVTILRFTASVL